MRKLAFVLACIVVCASAATLRSQVSLNDPLTPLEADQVRGTAGELDQRVKLLTQFAQKRLVQFAKTRLAPASAPDRSAQLYELLRQYALILPELDNAVDDMMATRNDPGGPHYKVNKVLAQLIKTEQSFLDQLHTIQNQSSPADLATYHFQLDDCVDRTTNSIQNAQEAIADAKKEDVKH